ncbi:probable tyrosyl-DNA phosphodiesterase [Sitophilus oryzae]|uniref:Probable tyrosyl-DNA phosphodiesterase n=1 Tax=Sitophilus oryzae TaxID=7048 RepID=A0A6J2XHX5_SITOR|nr:probable tyrosyl-DNA phosphodiesterase [Sitophilus oryzae]
MVNNSETKFRTPLEHEDLQVYIQPKLNVSLKLSDRSSTQVELPFSEYFRLFYTPDSPVLEKLGENKDKVTIKDKMKDAEPYNLFTNSLSFCEGTEEQLYSIKFTDLLCPSLGNVKKSLLFTHRIDVQFLIEQYAARKLHCTPITVIFGSENPKVQEPVLKELYPNIDFHIPHTDKLFNIQSAHCLIFQYDDNSIRIVIGSPSIYAPDWNNYNGLIWISPRCPKLPSGMSQRDGESKTGFKSDLLNFLLSYKIQSLGGWINVVKSADFSEVRVFLVYGRPGIHQPRKNGCPLHFLGHLLSHHYKIPPYQTDHDLWRIIVQSSSLGKLGRTPDEWFTTWFLNSLSSSVNNQYLPTLRPTFKGQFSVLYPTIENALTCFLGPVGAWGSRYDADLRDQQRWLEPYLCSWKADSAKRTKAIFHSRTVCRISPCCKKLAYFYLTTSNISRAGWGKIEDGDITVKMRTYHTGILFLPKFFDKEYFEVADLSCGATNNKFPIMYDLPLTPYGPEDEPYCLDEMIERRLVDLDNMNIDKPRFVSDVKDSDVKTPSEEKWDKFVNIAMEDKRIIPKSCSVLPSTSTFFPTFNKN